MVLVYNVKYKTYDNKNTSQYELYCLAKQSNDQKVIDQKVSNPITIMIFLCFSTLPVRKSRKLEKNIESIKTHSSLNIVCKNVDNSENTLYNIIT